MKVALVTHAVFIDGKDIYGPPHAVSLFLNKHKVDHIFIKHTLETTGLTLVETYCDGALVHKKSYGSNSRFPSVFHYFWEFILTIFLLCRNISQNTILLGYDPLNSFAVILLKTLFGAQNCVYVSADFAKQRFSTAFLNKIYHYLDRYAMSYTDETWSVSKRIIDYRKKMGLSKSKNKYVPNAPFYNTIPRKSFSSIDRYAIVLVSAIENTIDFKKLIDAFAHATRSYPKLSLHIIGSGSRMGQLRKYIASARVKTKVVLHGVLSHEDMFAVLVQCGIGIALYHEADPLHFRYYSDPMKIRDYMASGLPVIASGNSALGYEIDEKHAGIQVNLSTDTIVSALTTILSSEKTHKTMRNNALVLAKKYDSDTILKRRFTSLGLKVQ
jgi:glycosyltransferase involved in cell wall biosynthesis